MKREPVSIEQLLEIGIALSAEKDSGRLLRTIVEAAMNITGCDGGTLYTLSGDALKFEIIVTRSMGVDKGGGQGAIDLPPVPLRPENVCARSALDRRLYNVSDVYGDPRFDFSGPRRYDAITGYKTTSMLVIPMEDDRGDVIGVLQLINAQAEDGSTVPFDPDCEKVIQSLASQAAIKLTNLNYNAEMIETLDSFVRVMSTAIDARSPYNANHTRNMVKYCERFLTWAAERGLLVMDETERRQLLMSVWLHDVGKLVIPLEIMDKQDRLGAARSEIAHRFREIALLDRIALLSGTLSQAGYDAEARALAEAEALVAEANTAGFLSEEAVSAIDGLAARRYVDEDGISRPWLTEEERESLSIRKGTLTAEERGVIESHAVMTERMLSQMNFSRDYAMVPQWAAAHHEYLNGKGYPHRLSGGQIPTQVRLITILDVFDALTARDRPYKPALPPEKALSILDDMARSGQVDGELLAWFKESRAWGGGPDD